MTTRVFRAAVLAVALPFLLSVVVYYGFATNYTAGVFHEASFRTQYEHGIFKYRILGRASLLGTYAFLTSENLPRRLARMSPFVDLPVSMRALDPQADRLFYAAYFVHNTFFLLLASIVLWLLVARPGPGLPSAFAAQMTGVVLMTITQYVVVPYDTLSYFLTLLSFLFIVRPFRYSYPALLFVVVLSTLARESSALTLSFFFAYHFSGTMSLKHRPLRQLAGLVGALLFTYLVIRLQPGREPMLYQGMRLGANIRNLYNVAGMLALPVLAYPLCAGSPYLRRCLVFVVAASPYILAMVIVAKTWEIRLWVPVWLGLLMLGRDLGGARHA